MQVPGWNPVVTRCHRIGQTIDKYVNDVQECKRIAAREILQL